jgi:hypothetical protein
MTRAEQLAEAYILTSMVDHYMIGVVEPVTFDDLEAAKAILIDYDNAENNKNNIINLALDLVEQQERKERFR